MQEAHDSEASISRPLGMAGVCDCHVHIFGPTAQFPYVAERRYTPHDASVEEYRSTFLPLGVQRAVLTAPSVYGNDNRALINGLKAGGSDFRGIVMLSVDVEDEVLQKLHASGVRGVRTQISATGGKPLDVNRIRQLAARVATFGWHTEIHVDVAALANIDELLADFPTPVVIEHMGHMQTSEGTDHAGFQALLRFLDAGGWAKLSGAYINSVSGPPYRDVEPFVAQLLAVAPARLVWGSNWPHPHQEPPPDDELLVALIERWLPDRNLRQKVLVSNPEALYDF